MILLQSRTTAVKTNKLKLGIFILIKLYNIIKEESKLIKFKTQNNTIHCPYTIKCMSYGIKICIQKINTKFRILITFGSWIIKLGRDMQGTSNV